MCIEQKQYLRIRERTKAKKGCYVSTIIKQVLETFNSFDWTPEIKESLNLCTAIRTILL